MYKSNLALCLLLFISISCNTTGTDTSKHFADSTKGNVSMRLLGPGEDTAFIPIDTANRMIGSYLASVHSGGGADTNLHSLIIDANALREYLTSDSGNEISHLKIMFAHKLSYINSGHKDQPCGYSPNGFTVILAGFNNEGNYVYFRGSKVEDMSRPCPYDCVTDGSASNDLLVH